MSSFPITEQAFLLELQNGLDPFLLRDGKTWLFEALSQGWIDASRVLLEKKASPKTRSHGQPAIFALTHLQDPWLIDSAVTLLREYKTSLNDLDLQSNSILDWASRQNHVGLLRRLLEESDYDFRDIRRATLAACEDLSPEALDILLRDPRTDFKEGVPRQVKRIQFENTWKAAQQKTSGTQKREAVLALLSGVHPLNGAENCRLFDNPGHGHFVKRAFEKRWASPPHPEHYRHTKLSAWPQKRYVSQWLQCYDFSPYLPNSDWSKQSENWRKFHQHEKERLTRQYLNLFSEGRLAVIKRLSKQGITPRKELRQTLEYALGNRHYKLVHWMSKEGWITPDVLESYLNNPRYGQARIALEQLSLRETMPKREPSRSLKTRI